MDADEEYSAYVSARWTTLLRAAILLGCPSHEAEDLVQATLVKCYVAWDKVRNAHDKDAYVYRILVNTHTSNRRRFWGRERPVDDMPVAAAVNDETELSDLTDSVQRALAGLSRQSRAVVVLRYFADLTEQQTAYALGVPSGTVKSRLSRALDHLADDPNLCDLPGRESLR